MLANVTAMHSQATKYTQAQRQAMAAAFEQPGVTARDVVELAAAGALTHPTGARLDPFTAPQSTVRAEAGRARLRRERETARAKLSEMEPRDATERMRCRLADAIEVEMDRLDLEQAESHDDDVRAASRRIEQLRQITRAVREFCWLPGPNEPRPQAPGAKRNGTRQGGETRGGFAGRLLRASEEQDPGPRIPIAIGNDHSRNGH